MNKTNLIAVLALASLLGIGVLGYNKYSLYQQQQRQLAHQQQLFNQEKQALEQAESQQSIEAINHFIATYPQSQWLEKAIYQRDKLAYQLASQTNSAQELDNFINNYPDSQWLEQAKMKQQRLLREQKQGAERQQRQAKIEAQREQFEQQATRQPPPSNTISQNTKQKKPASVDSKDRVARALAIYQKQRQQEQKVINQKQQQVAKQNKTRQRCLSLKDQIEQYDKRRVRWYDLDENGERVFLSKKQVAESKKSLEKQYQERCL